MSILKAIRQKEDQLAEEILTMKQKLSELERLANSRGLSGLFRSSSVPDQIKPTWPVCLTGTKLPLMESNQVNRQYSCPVFLKLPSCGSRVLSPLTIMGDPIDSSSGVQNSRVSFCIYQLGSTSLSWKLLKMFVATLIQMSCCGKFLFYLAF